ncbi:MAG: hypothetical protein BWX69_02451 [Planctomycetes bacterium ADurb.Bin069]|nr:MAG: hypothetical protein BWX69_02451 [Planctomycetes bacterium ADurb.Bin069]
MNCTRTTCAHPRARSRRGFSHASPACLLRVVRPSRLRPAGRIPTDLQRGRSLGIPGGRSGPLDLGGRRDRGAPGSEQPRRRFPRDRLQVAGLRPAVPVQGRAAVRAERRRRARCQGRRGRPPEGWLRRPDPRSRGRTLQDREHPRPDAEPARRPEQRLERDAHPRFRRVAARRPQRREGRRGQGRQHPRGDDRSVLRGRPRRTADVRLLQGPRRSASLQRAARVRGQAFGAGGGGTRGRGAEGAGEDARAAPNGGAERSP